MTKIKMNKEIMKFDPHVKPLSDEFLAYQVIFAATAVGTAQQNILRFLNTDRWKKAAKFIYKAKRSQIFVGDKLDGEIYSSGIGLALGCAVLLGYVDHTVRPS